jgi:TPR repeat protein
MRRRRRPVLLAPWVVIAVLVGCGSAKVVRPDAIAGAAALGESSKTCPTAHSSPLVVDWTADERANLELAMQGSVAVVAYTCDGIELLRDCHVSGSYGYVGVTQQEENVQIDDHDELSANLPRMGALMGAKLSAEMKQGATIDIATVMVGKSRTNVERATRVDLVGDCARATHFVRGASLGAFAMQQGTHGKVRAAVDLFGSKEEGNSSSAKATTSKAGVLDACKGADRGDNAPPKQCGALLRVELDAIDSGQPGGQAARESEGSVCPQGLVYASGKCARPGSVTSYECNGSDVQDCTTQCSRGNGDSCMRLGEMYKLSLHVKQDLVRAASLFQQGCDRGSQESCNFLGLALLNGQGVTKSVPRAATLFQKACDAGRLAACTNLGLVYDGKHGMPENDSLDLSLATRACKGGRSVACHNLAIMYFHGKGVPKDLARAKALAEQSCQEGKASGIGCQFLGLLYRDGSGVAQDDAAAFRYYKMGCARGDGGASCADAAAASWNGRGTAQDYAQSIKFRERSCTLLYAPSCRVLGNIFTKKTPPDLNEARRFYQLGCNEGDAESCQGLRATPGASH